MTTKIEERNSNNSGMTEAETEALRARLAESEKELTDANADLADLADDCICKVRHTLMKFAYACESSELKIVLLNLLRYAEETYTQTGIDTAIICSGEYPDGIEAPNVVRHLDVLAALTDCLTTVYFPEDSRFC